jgi:hypothetical protein
VRQPELGLVRDRAEQFFDHRARCRNRRELRPLKKAIVSKLAVMGSKESTDYMMEILNK